MSFAVITAQCAVFGYFAMFNSFAPWDDEGYFLIAVKEFAHHGGLYTNVFSQYGPFPYEAYSMVFSWLPMTLNSGRVATLIVLLLTSLGFGVAIKMFTGSLLAAVATQVSSFVLLPFGFVDESMHPADLACLLFAVALVALALVARGKPSVGYLLLGAAVAALALTHVNAGAFAAIALLFTWLALAPPLRLIRTARAAATVLFVATPFLLIWVAGGPRTEPWAAKYALVVMLAAIGVAALSLDRRLQGLVHGRDALRFLFGGSSLGALVLVIALVSGTRPVDFIRGAFIGPANQANAFTFPLFLPVWVELWGAACLVGAVWYRRFRLRSSSGELVDACAHVAAGLLILYGALANAQLNRPSMAFAVSFTTALPLLFVAAIPPNGATDSERVARVAVVALAVLEGLQAYPVAGSQVFIDPLLVVPAGMLCLNDGVRQLGPALAGARRHGRSVATNPITPVVLFAGLAWLAWVFIGDLSAEASTYYSGAPTTLPGTSMVRLPAGQAASLESLSQAIRAQCSGFVSLPGMNSFYFWTEESPPTRLNAGEWMFLLDSAQQQQIVHRIGDLRRSRFCVVDNPSVESFWQETYFEGGRPIPQLPLVRLIQRFEQDNSPSESFGGYRLFVGHGGAP